MRGYTQNPINDIRRLLKECYKKDSVQEYQYPIIKEIIQNTDDSGASELIFGWTNGLQNTTHPLLKQRKAIFFINNGDFTQDDEDAIASFGSDAKASDKATIGKFGLGQKSIFHICDAFFYFGKGKNHSNGDLINPFYNDIKKSDPTHPSWEISNDLLPKDIDLIKEYLSEFVKNQETYFVLWLPLRNENDYDNGVIFKENIYNDFEALFHPKLKIEVCNLLPSLVNLETIIYVKPHQNEDNFSTEFQVKLDGERRKINLKDVNYWDGIIENTNSESFSGHLNIDDEISCWYYANEKLLDVTNYRDKLKAFWPQVLTINGDEELDKSVPHCAVTFIKISNGSGHFISKWSVFLPVVDIDKPKKVGGEYDFVLLLHGYFFLNSCRSQIIQIQEKNIDYPSNEEETQQLWNKLITEGTLSLLLITLSEFVEKNKLPFDEIKILSNGIKLSLFPQYQKNICQQYQWVCCLTPKGKEWRLLSKETPLLALPNPPQTIPQRPWETFPELANLEKNSGFIFTTKEMPNLLSGNIPQWKLQDVQQILQINIKEVFTKEGLLNYFSIFLKEEAKPYLNLIQNDLIQIINTAFTTLGIKKLKELLPKVKEVIALIDQDKRFTINEKNSPEIIEKLQHCETTILLLPDEFTDNKLNITDNESKAKLTISDAEIWLIRLDQLIEQYEKDNSEKLLDSARKIAKEIIKGVQDKSSFFGRGDIKKLRILNGYNAQKGKRTSLSIEDIRNSEQQKILFTFSQGTTEQERLGLSGILQKVIPHNTILLIDKETRELVYGEEKHNLIACNPKGCLEALTEPKTLGDISARKNLLSKLAGENFESQVDIRAIRYLLHGNKEQFVNTQQKLWVLGYKQEPVWQKLWEQLQGQSKPWYLLERELLKIDQDYWDKLEIYEIQFVSVLKEIEDKKRYNLLKLSDQNERDIVLTSIKNKDLWCKLPFHKTVSGELVAIDDKCYLESDFDLPEQLQKNVKIICKNSNDDVLRQQKEWIQVLTEEKVISIALENEFPHQFWKLIMDVLIKVQPSFALKEKLQNTSWLVDKNQQSVKPCDVIHLEKLKDDVSRLVAENKGIYWTPENLHEEIRCHHYFNKLKIFFANEDQSLKILGELSGKSENYILGNLTINNSEELQPFLVLKDIASSISQGWAFFSKVCDVSSLEKAYDHLFPSLNKPLNIDTIISILKWLSEQDSKNKDYLKIFNCYLTLFVEQPNARDKLKQLRLLNRKGNWKLSGELCANVGGVDDEHVVNDEQARFIKLINIENYKSINSKLPVTYQQVFDTWKQNPKITADNLNDYFKTWQNYISNNVLIGIFISLLGDDKNVKELAQNFLGKYTVEAIRDRLGWEIPQREINELDKWLSGYTSEQAFAKFKFIFDITDRNKVEVTSLIGNEIIVSLHKKFDSLIVGQIKTYSDRKSILIRMRRLDTVQYPEQNLSKLLKNTCCTLFEYVYSQRTAKLDILWEEFEKGDQLDVAIAQKLILDNIPLYVRQLKIEHGELQQTLKALDNAKRDIALHEQQKNSSKIKKYQEEKNKQLEQIQQLFKNDITLQSASWKAVKNKIESFQYSLLSIPFELFQNADDAVVQINQIETSNTSLPHTKHFKLDIQPNAIYFMHWGRPINYTGQTAGFNGEECGFHQDLENMLVLSLSDKQVTNENNQVTGKFGLGFKSIFLLSNKPKLISGRLAVEIAGGLLPIKLEDQQRSALNNLLKKHTNSSVRSHSGTLIEAPLTTTHNPKDVLYRFEYLSRFLVIFARQIRHIDIHGKQPLSVHWTPNEIDEGIEYGEISMPSNEEKGALCFRCHSGSFLILLDSKGCCSIVDKDSKIPRIWVTAPIQENVSANFLINANFEIDVGRVRLAANNKNEEIVKKLGEELGKKWVTLFQKDWNQLAQNLLLEKGITCYDFWYSFWKTLTEKELSYSLFKVLLANDGCGLKYLLEHQKALPNGLWKEYQNLTDIKKVQYVLQGALSKEGCFLLIMKLEIYPELSAENTISEDIYNSKTLKFFGKKPQPLKLEDIFQSFINKARGISSEIAEELGKIINRNFIDKLGEEKANLYKVLQCLKFKTNAGDFKYGSELLIPNRQNEDESKRAGFAPNDRQLADNYKETAIDFFLVCREKMQAPAEEMARWIRNATDDTKREKGLRYLLNGELREPVAENLRSNIFGWLRDLKSQREQHPLLKKWTEEDKIELLIRKLGTSAELTETNSTSTAADNNDRKQRSPNLLFDIYEWWSENKEEELRKYQRNTYPNAKKLELTNNIKNQDNRKNWLISLILGATHSIGRQKNEQHKGFVQRCEQKGWLNTFATANPQENPEAWIDILEKYIETYIETYSEEYQHWMKLFPAIYRFSRYLDQYVELFMSLDRHNKEFNLEQFLAPHSNPAYQGGGINAPPIGRSLGKIGASFVLRELIRNKTLKTNSFLIPHCYPPVSRVKKFLESMGGKIETSKDIYEFLVEEIGEKKATFDGAFDIPLLLWLKEYETS